MTRGKCGLESEAQLVRQAHQIIAELPIDTKQACKVLTYARKLLRFQGVLMAEVEQEMKGDVSVHHNGSGLRLLTIIAITVQGVAKLAGQPGLHAIIEII